MTVIMMIAWSQISFQVNLALALKRVNPSGNIGLLDSDVFGPSIPLMMNLSEVPLVNQDKMIEPLQNYGIKWLAWEADARDIGVINVKCIFLWKYDFC